MFFPTVVTALAVLLAALWLDPIAASAAAVSAETVTPPPPASAPVPLPAPDAAPGLNLVLNLPALALRVIVDGQTIGSLAAAIGNPRTPTPVCSTRIISRVIDPTWHPTDGRPPVPPGPANPLGKYWLALGRRNYGLHGTNNSSSIGKAISGGCVRFGDADIEYLYNLVKIGTPVDIVYRRVEVVSWFGRPVALVHPDVYSCDPLTPAALASRLAALGLDPLPSEGECAALLVSSKTATAWWPSGLTAGITTPAPAASPGEDKPHPPPPGLLYYGGGSLGGGGPLQPGQAEVIVQGVASTLARGWLLGDDLWVPAEWVSAALGREVHISARYGWAFFVWPELCLDVPARCRELGGVYHVPLTEIMSAFCCRVVPGETRWKVWLAP
ncbi:MAG: L,D-transpeptidase [Bacillota bacterium]|nr:L,D-transpeptidase [Bacillota bacterium]